MRELQRHQDTRSLQAGGALLEASSLSEFQTHPDNGGAPPPFRVDVPLHQLLAKLRARPALLPSAQPRALPEPVFPQHPSC